MCSISGKPAATEHAHAALSGEALLRMDMEAAEALFNALPMQQQLQVVLSAPWSKRQDIIMLSSDARLIVQEIPEQEVYWMIRERGIEDSLPVISRTSQEQFQYITDIDCWARDELDPERCAEWLLMLSKCNEQKVTEWLRKTDPEFLALCFKRFMTVRKVQGETDISEEYVSLPAFTIDNVYYCAFKHEAARMFMPPFLHLLFQYDYAGYTSLLEAVIWDLLPEVQDEAYRWRRARIAEKGFPEIGEAQALYRIVPEHELALLKQRADAYRSPQQPGTPARTGLLRFGFNAQALSPFLAELLKALDDAEALDELQAEIVGLANKVLVADVLDTRSSADMLRALHKALGCIAIAVEDLSGGSIPDGVGLLAHTHPEILFQAGFTRIMRLQEMIRSHPWTIGMRDRELFRTLYPTVWTDTVEGIFFARPLFNDDLRRVQTGGRREFMCLDDVVAARRAIETMQAADHIICTVLAVTREQILHARGPLEPPEHSAGAACQQIFATMLAHNMLSGHPQLKPLTGAELREFLKRAGAPDGPENSFRLRRDLLAQAMRWLSDNPRYCHSFAAGAERFTRGCLEQLEDEFSRLAGNKYIDYRYVSGILLQGQDAWHPDEA